VDRGTHDDLSNPNSIVIIKGDIRYKTTPCCRLKAQNGMLLERKCGGFQMVKEKGTVLIEAIE
jgi:hypothetical protein